MSDLISRQDAIAKLKEHRKIFCKNRLDFTILPDKDKARVDEIDACIATLINLPSAQPDVPDINVGDMISRQAAVTEIAKFMLEYGGENEKRERDALHRAANGIKALPSAQPEQRWISSGKKPLKEGSYLVWMPFAPPKHRVAAAEYCGGYWNIKTPISAWMPLQEPYKEGQGG